MVDEILNEIKFTLNLEDIEKSKAITRLKYEYKISRDLAIKVYDEWKKWYCKIGYFLKGQKNKPKEKSSVRFDVWIVNKVKHNTKGLTKMDYIDIAWSYGKYERKLEIIEQLHLRGIDVSLNFISVIAKEAYDKGYVGGKQND